jgi:hypothetical protein
MFLEELKEWESLDAEFMNLLRVAMHPINFWTSQRLSDDFILVIADTFSGLESIP